MLPRRRQRRYRLWAADGDPGPLAWAIAWVSLVLPVVGLLLVVLGGIRAFRGEAGGWLLLGAGAGAIILDLVIDFVWAHPGFSRSDLPDLNRRGAQLVGRIVVLAEPIAAGRGKARVGDGLWPVEGPDLPAGHEVRVIAANGTVLVVEPL